MTPNQAIPTVQFLLNRLPTSRMHPQPRKIDILHGALTAINLGVHLLPPEFQHNISK
jgi:hypothetical protein